MNQQDVQLNCSDWLCFVLLPSVTELHRILLQNTKSQKSSVKIQIEKNNKPILTSIAGSVKTWDKYVTDYSTPLS